MWVECLPRNQAGVYTWILPSSNCEGIVSFHAHTWPLMSKEVEIVVQRFRQMMSMAVA